MAVARMTFFILDFLFLNIRRAGMISERCDGAPIHLAGIIFIIKFLVYLLKMNLFCRKNKGVRERQMKGILLFVM